MPTVRERCEHTLKILAGQFSIDPKDTNWATAVLEQLAFTVANDEVQRRRDAELRLENIIAGGPFIVATESKT